MASFTNPYPSWGDVGTSPPSGFQYEGGDQVREDHLDYLWNQQKQVTDDIIEEFARYDSDDDGIVNKADKVVNGYTDQDAIDAVDGEVDNSATTVSELDNVVSNKASDNHDNSSHSESYITANDIPFRSEEVQKTFNGSQELIFEPTLNTNETIVGWSYKSSDNEDLGGFSDTGPELELGRIGDDGEIRIFNSSSNNHTATVTYIIKT